jgi:hypothetical protein
MALASFVAWARCFFLDPNVSVSILRRSKYVSSGPAERAARVQMVMRRNGVGAGTQSDLGTKGGDMPTEAARTTSVRIMGLLQGSGVPQVRHPEWRLVHLAPPQ